MHLYVMGGRNQLITDIVGVFEGLFQRKHGEIKGDVAEAIWITLGEASDIKNISLKIRTCTCINTFKQHSVHFCGIYIYVYNIFLIILKYIMYIPNPHTKIDKWTKQT